MDDSKKIAVVGAYSIMATSIASAMQGNVFPYYLNGPPLERRRPNLSDKKIVHKKTESDKIALSKAEAKRERKRQKRLRDFVKK